jgi:hypothetical protein
MGGGRVVMMALVMTGRLRALPRIKERGETATGRQIDVRVCVGVLGDERREGRVRVKMRCVCNR